MSFQQTPLANYPFAQSWMSPCDPRTFGTSSSNAPFNKVNISQFFGLDNQISKHLQQGFRLAPRPNLPTLQSSYGMNFGLPTAERSLLFQPLLHTSGPQAQFGQRPWPAVQPVKLSEVLNGFKNFVQRQFKISDAEWALLMLNQATKKQKQSEEGLVSTSSEKPSVSSQSLTRDAKDAEPKGFKPETQAGQT